MFKNVLRVENGNLVIPFTNVDTKGVIMRHGALAWSGYVVAWAMGKEQKKEDNFQFVSSFEAQPALN
ncbi:hypothetical protein CO218_11250 [Lactiplantibacillus plantarum]|uniref:hypothetical protein n=1 Tax=Lactiplantibacillus plantarum TaxID=1590 RepID=UPI0007BC10B8|nr:hypothetical protein [Lactiplantibacillus plantarum]AYE59645.1 hypothetical protein CO218_11250 [Lactiplantibacillus plantarum]KZU57214.1 hypothetical protein Nizo2776_0434 [Lactiplantibacillus plantarum]QBJ54711.1 hypothetical protein C3O83_00890 [Lactiplantibacillus plantarum]